MKKIKATFKKWLLGIIAVIIIIIFIAIIHLYPQSRKGSVVAEILATLVTSDSNFSGIEGNTFEESIFELPWEKMPEMSKDAVLKKLFPKSDLSVTVISSKQNLVNSVKAYIDQNPNILGPLMTSGDFQIKVAQCVKGRRLQDTCYVVLNQHKDGVEIIGSYINATIKIINGQSKLVSLIMKVAPEIKTFSTTPLLAQSQIIEKAKQVYRDSFPGFSTGQYFSPLNFTIQENKIIYYGGKWRLITKVKIEDPGSHENYFSAHVDANSGQVWLSDDRVFVEGKVKGRGVEAAYLNIAGTLDLLKLPHLKVTADSGEETYTDISGHFSLPITAPTTVTLRPEGRWSTVSNDPSYGGEELTIFLPPVSPSENIGALTFNPEGNIEENTAQINAYYHTTFIHDWLCAKDICEEINTSILTNVNFPGRCDAFYDPADTSINFFHSTSSEGRLCANTAYDTIIYHEYGHFVDDMIGGITGRGLSEGWGDLITTYATGQPFIGGLLSDQNREPYLRTANNTYIFHDTDDIHSQGQAWAGFAWHLRENLINLLGPIEGVALAEELVIPVLYANNERPEFAVLEVLIRDDDDGDVMNGTPHVTEIEAAARMHGILLDFDDNTPPGLITDLAASLAEFPDRFIDLSWTAPGDDGIASDETNAPVSGYDVRMAKAPDKLTEDNFDSMPRVVVESTSLLDPNPYPLPPGELEHARITCLEPDTTYNFGLKARDDNFNWSPLSNTDYETTMRDGSPPQIRDIRSYNVTSTSADISWRHEDFIYGPPPPAPPYEVTGFVEYDISPRDYLYSIPVTGQQIANCSPTVQFQTHLQELAPNTLYYYRVHSFDRAGNETVSGDYTFMTPGISCPNDGTPFWTRTEPFAVFPGGEEVARDSFGNIFVVGTTRTFHGSMEDADIFVAAYNSCGILIDTDIIPGPLPDQDDKGKSIAVAHEEFEETAVFVGGIVTTSIKPEMGITQRALIRKYSFSPSDGFVPQWTVIREDGEGEDQLIDIVAKPSGLGSTIYAVGSSRSNNLWFRRYSGMNGQYDLVSELPHILGGNVMAFSMIEDSSAEEGVSFYIVSQLLNSSLGDAMAIIKVKDFGSFIGLDTQFTSNGYEERSGYFGKDIAIHPVPSGDVYAIGTTPQRRTVIFKYDARINFVSAFRVFENVVGEAIAITGSYGGKIAVVGSESNPTDPTNIDAVVKLLNLDGSQVWSRSFDSGGPDVANDVMFDIENYSLVVTGISDGNIWTKKYSLGGSSTP